MKSSHSSPKKDQVKSGFSTKFEGKPLAVAILAHLLLLIVAFFITFNYFKPVKHPADFVPTGQSGGGGGGGSRDANYQIQTKRRAQITPNPNVKRIFAEGVTTQVAIPEVVCNPSQMAKLGTIHNPNLPGGLGGLGGGLGNGFGSGFGNGFGSGFGSGFGNNLGFDQIPVQMRKRCSKAERLQRLEEKGGTPGCEDAVVKGLNWLKANQNPDGSWGKCHKIAMTGFTLLAYFGHCETPTSQEFGESIIKGIIYLINIGIKNHGRLIDPDGSTICCYEHAIGTYALGEAITFCKDLDLVVPLARETTRQAANYIMSVQNFRGSWDYDYNKFKNQGDPSISGWQVQALKACRNVPIRHDILASVIDKALHYINSCQGEAGGFGYSGPSNGSGYQTLTGVGMLCNQIWAREESPEVRKAADHIYLNSKFDYNASDSNLYSHYYESQAMMQIGGRYWDKYNQMFRDNLLENQNSNGSWNSPPDQRGGSVGRELYVGDSVGATVYRTALCILMLEVYYRNLSANDAGGEPPIHEKPDI